MRSLPWYHYIATLVGPRDLASRVAKAMTATSKLFFGLLSLFACFQTPAVCAQTCPVGSYPVGGGNAGWEGCVPMNDSAPPPPPGPEWRTQWIAIALGGTGFGAGIDMPSKQKAEKEALAQCRRSTKDKCRIAGVTYNQCMATADSGVSAMNFRAPKLQDAEQGALQYCRESEPNANCRIHFSHCSYPVRIR
jgi:hypothetical protein